MKRYFDLKDFVTFLNLLEVNRTTELYSECLEDGFVYTHKFLKMEFGNSSIILYDHPSGHVGIIQDTPVAPWDDYAEGVYEDLTMNDEYKVFIESK